jgi:hypothetical protein
MRRRGEQTIALSESSGVYLTGREIAQVRQAALGRATGFVGALKTPSAYSSA